MAWREMETAEKHQVWVISGDLIPLGPKIERVPVVLDPAKGNPGSPATTTISRNIYQAAQRCHRHLFFDGTHARAIKIEGGALLIDAD